MQIGDIKSFRKAILAFGLVGFVLLGIMFGSVYFGRYGFSLVPLSRWQADGLWWLLFTDFCRSAGGAMVAATVTFMSSRTRNEKTRDAS